MMIRNCLWLVLVAWFSITSFGQSSSGNNSEHIEFDRLEQVKELQNYTVNSIIQDDIGFMWFGTLNGLIRFDGYKIKVYKNDFKNSRSLSSNTITALAKDHAGNIWIATQGGGLNKFDVDKETFTHYQHKPKDSTSISDNSLVSVFVDSRDRVWVGTYSNGINLLDQAANTFKRFDGSQYFPVRSIREDEEGLIWFSSNGLTAIDKDFSLQHFPAQEGDPVTLANGGIRSFLHQNKETIFAATHDEEGVFKLNTQTGKYTKVQWFDKERVSAYALFKDAEKRLWIGTSKGLAIGVNDKFDRYQFDACDPTSLGKKIILSIYQDRVGTIWIGTEGGGVNKVQPKTKFAMAAYPKKIDFLTHNSIRTLYEDSQDRLWIGWVEGGLEIYDRVTGKVTPVLTHGIDNFTCILQDYDSTFWAGSWGHGLLHLSQEGKLIHQYLSEPNGNSVPDNRIQALLRDNHGYLWVATENGLSQFDTNENTWKEFRRPYFNADLIGNNIQSLAFIEAPDGTLWAGTWLGLNRIAPDRKSVKHYQSKSSLYALYDHIISLHFDALKNVIWIGTYEGGLRMLDVKSGEMSYYTEEDGLPNNTVYAIKPDNAGNLWLSTNNGLSKFNPATGVFRNYDVTDGLQGNEFFWGVALKKKNGEMIFGGVNGLNVFDPNEIKDNAVIPPVVFTNFEIFNKPLQIGSEQSPLQAALNAQDEIKLTYDQSVFTFEFAALNYIRPEKNQYAYMLENFDEDWNYLKDSRVATFTNIDPGEYVFRVKASNNDHVWNEEGKSIRIIITPPFWLTWWFKASIFFFVSGTLLLFYRIRISTITRQRAELEWQVNQRTLEIQNKSKEIVAQMEKVEQLKDEIAAQRDSIELQNTQLANAKSDLEQKVVERTQELSQTNQELMEQNAQLEQFAFMTAHNLRAPVARLLGLTAIFNGRDVADPLNVEIIKRVQTSASGLDEVIRDIADILQVKKGIHRNVEPLEVLPAIQRALKSLRHEIELNNMTVINLVEPDNWISGIGPYVHSVFYNLVSNAVKYADLTKGPELKIFSKNENGLISIVFQDNGIGFDAVSQKEKLFKPFSRLNAHGEGKGLGLFLVKMQMESMKGLIEVDSHVNVGTSVKLIFKAEQKPLT